MTVREFNVSFAFHWLIPDTLLYHFRQKKEEGKGWEPVDIKGCSLSNGDFFIDKFANSGDIFTFQLYEWMHEERSPSELHAPPRTFQFDAKNFEIKNLFTAPSRFDVNSFLPIPKLQSEEDEPSPFPGLPHLYSWLDAPAASQHFFIRHLQDDQVFKIRAKAVVPSLQDTSPRSTRTFLFDPEMTVGDDGGTGPDTDVLPPKGSK